MWNGCIDWENEFSMIFTIIIKREPSVRARSDTDAHRRTQTYTDAHRRKLAHTGSFRVSQSSRHTPTRIRAVDQAQRAKHNDNKNNHSNGRTMESARIGFPNAWNHFGRAFHPKPKAYGGELKSRKSKEAENTTQSMITLKRISI